MGGGARRAGWSDFAHRCCLVLCTAAIAGIGVAALGAPASPATKRTVASRPSVHPTHDRSHATRARSSAHLARPRHGVRHARTSVDRSVSPDERINDNTVAIIADGVGSTDLAIVQDLSAVLDEGDGLRILPVVGAGGGRNIRDVRFMSGVDLGITQTNVLARLRESNEAGPSGEKIVYLTKLFNEEMHILVRADSDLVAIGQLAGRTVSLGESGSGTQMAARDVLERLGIAVHETNMAAPEAIERLKSGDIDAVVVVGGKPVPGLASLPAGFRMLAIPFAKPLREDFLPAMLSSTDYPGLIEPNHRIETLAVGTLLIARDWPRASDRFRKIERFVAAFFPQLAALQAPPRHPKWREVNLAASVAGATRSSAAQEWLVQHREVAEQGRSLDRLAVARPSEPSRSRE